MFTESEPQTQNTSETQPTAETSSEVTTAMSQAAIESTVGSVPEVQETGNDLLEGMTIPDSEEGTDAAAVEAARRQVEADLLNQKIQNLNERAAREDWAQDKYDSERQKLNA